MYFDTLAQIYLNSMIRFFFWRKNNKKISDNQFVSDRMLINLILAICRDFIFDQRIAQNIFMQTEKLLAAD